MDKPEKVNAFNFEKIKHIKPDKEKSVFSLCLLFTIVISFKLFYIVVYHLKAESVFHNKPVCATYKTLYASELDKGELANTQPILQQAGTEKCIKNLEVKTPKDKEVNKEKKEVQEDRAYNSLTIHEIDKR